MKMEPLRILAKNMEIKRTTPKSIIRSKKLAERGQLPDEQCRVKSHAISERLLQEAWYKDTSQILLYRAVNHEVSLSFFMEQAWKDHKTLYFPRVSGMDMDFYRADSMEAFRPGFFHILEPNEDCPAYIPEQEAVMIVPGAAFSEAGDRIGYGKGYYDRYLNQHSGKFKLVGAAYEMQLLKPWKTEEFDIKMDVIITENRKVVCKNESGTNV